MAVDADGDFVIVWDHNLGQAVTVRGRRYDAAGVPRGDEFVVSQDQIESGPVVAMDADGDFVVAWHHLPFPPSAGNFNYDIYARRYAHLPFQANPAPAAFQPAALRLVVPFSRPVAPASLQPADLVFSLRDVRAGGAARGAADGQQFTATAVSYDPATWTATFTLAAGQVLPNGNFTATLAPGSVTDTAGNPLDHPFTADFYVLAGDVNRDRFVNGTDFAILAGNFGKTGMTYAQGDLNGDGAVNGTDFALLAGNFGKTVPPPAAAAEAMPAPASAPTPPAAPTAKAAPRRTPPARRPPPAVPAEPGRRRLTPL